MAYPYNLDPANSDVDKIRLNIADTDSDNELIPNALYEYWLTLPATNPVTNSTQLAVEYLIAKFARYVEEKTGEVQVKYQQLYDHYKDLSERLKDPLTGVSSAPMPYAGGISCEDIIANNENQDNNLAFPPIGWVSSQFR